MRLRTRSHGHRFSMTEILMINDPLNVGADFANQGIGLHVEVVCVLLEGCDVASLFKVLDVRILCTLLKEGDVLATFVLLDLK